LSGGIGLGVVEKVDPVVVRDLHTFGGSLRIYLIPERNPGSVRQGGNLEAGRTKSTIFHEQELIVERENGTGISLLT
jgi:hypothetical protein